MLSATASTVGHTGNIVPPPAAVRAANPVGAGARALAIATGPAAGKPTRRGAPTPRKVRILKAIAAIAGC